MFSSEKSWIVRNDQPGVPQIDVGFHMGKTIIEGVQQWPFVPISIVSRSVWKGKGLCCGPETEKQQAGDRQTTGFQDAVVHSGWVG